MIGVAQHGFNPKASQAAGRQGGGGVAPPGHSCLMVSNLVYQEIHDAGPELSSMSTLYKNSLTSQMM